MRGERRHWIMLGLLWRYGQRRFSAERVEKEIEIIPEVRKNLKTEKRRIIFSLAICRRSMMEIN